MHTAVPRAPRLLNPGSPSFQMEALSKRRQFVEAGASSGAYGARRSLHMGATPPATALLCPAPPRTSGRDAHNTHHQRVPATALLLSRVLGALPEDTAVDTEAVLTEVLQLVNWVAVQPRFLQSRLSSGNPLASPLEVHHAVLCGMLFGKSFGVHRAALPNGDRLADRELKQLTAQATPPTKTVLVGGGNTRTNEHAL